MQATTDYPVWTTSQAYVLNPPRPFFPFSFLRFRSLNSTRVVSSLVPFNSVPYAALVKCFTKIESTSSRLEIISYLTQFLLLVIQRAGPAAAEGGEKDAKGKGKEKETKTKDGLGAAENVLKVVYLSINRVSGIVSICFRLGWVGLTGERGTDGGREARTTRGGELTFSFCLVVDSSAPTTLDSNWDWEKLCW